MHTKQKMKGKLCVYVFFLHVNLGEYLWNKHRDLGVKKGLTIFAIRVAYDGFKIFCFKRGKEDFASYKKRNYFFGRARWV